MSYVIVNPQGRFWSGLRWRSEFPDAARYSGFPKFATSIPEGALVVRDYGEITERRFFSARSACPECDATGPHEDNGAMLDGPHVTYLCTTCGHQFDGMVR